MNRKIKSAIISIIVIVAIIVDIIWDVLLWTNAYVDGKYIFGDNDTYYLRVGSLSAAMFINLVVIIVLLLILATRRK
ncbi:MAG: hypothetical protein IKW97_05730 [Muribaculaceae bacterium]|nr:hypothetical protein [Muribaculaceae bacterium]